MNSDLKDYDIPIKDNYKINTDKININNNNLKKRKKQPKKSTKIIKNILLLIIIIILLFVAIYNIIAIIKWNNDNKKTKDTIDEITINTKIEEIVDNENTENINEPEEKTSDYWYYITFPLINVDFTTLKEKNSDTVAWINVNNTNINYPIVQTKDNDFYLDHSYDKTYNEAGWVFLDYRNNSDLSNQNNIIYAHSRLDKTMFGSLSKALKESWYKNKSNHIIRTSSETEDSLWQIFSVYTIKPETYYITTSFPNDDKYQEFLNTIKDRSKYNFNTELNTKDRILTLSTCYSDTERTVVHAKLIKRSPR